MSDATYHTTRQDLRKEETRTAQQHGGKIPADSDVSQMKVSFYFNDNRIDPTIYSQALLPVYHRPEHRQVQGD